MLTSFAREVAYNVSKRAQDVGQLTSGVRTDQKHLQTDKKHWRTDHASYLKTQFQNPCVTELGKTTAKPYNADVRFVVSAGLFLLFSKNKSYFASFIPFFDIGLLRTQTQI